MKVNELVKLLIFGNLIPIALIILAGYMVANDKPYWGWLIAAAILCGIRPATKD